MNSFTLEDIDYEVLAVLKTTYKNQGYCPGLTDLMKQLGKGQWTISTSLRRLVIAGEISMKNGKHRSIKVLDENSKI